MKSTSAFFETELLYFEKHDSDIPWVKIFTKHPYKELTDCDFNTQSALFKAIITTEKAMREYYSPDKINISSFGNYVPHLHLHIQARFKNDTHYPEPMWGVKQREASMSLKPFEGFVPILKSHFV